MRPPAVSAACFGIVAIDEPDASPDREALVDDRNDPLVPEHAVGGVSPGVEGVLEHPEDARAVVAEARELFGEDIRHFVLRFAIARERHGHQLHRILGIGFNFLSYYGLEAAGSKGALAQAAIVGFVLMGFYLYPVVTIFFGKWPIRPSDLKQPAAGFAEIGWATLFEIFGYVILIVPFFGFALKASPALGTSWWTGIGGTPHVHWVFGWWEWAVITLFMFPNVWRMKPFGLIKLPQPAKGFVYMGLSFVFAYCLALICINIAPLWLPQETIHELFVTKGQGEVSRFLWLHSAEIAGMTLIPFPRTAASQRVPMERIYSSGPRTSVTVWFQALFTPIPGYFSVFRHRTSALSVLRRI